MGDLLSYIHLFTFGIYLALIIYLLAKNPSSPLNRVCALFLACFALWVFGKIFTHRVDVSLSATGFFMNLVCLGAWSFGGVFLWFCCLLTEQARVLRNKLFYLWVFAVPGVIIAEQWLFGGVVEYVRRPFGWGISWQPNVWPKLMIAHVLSSMVVGLLLLIIFRFRTESRLRRKTIDTILVSASLPLLPGVAVNVVLPLLDVEQVPDLAQNLALFFAVGLVYAIVRYRFLIVTPATAAHKIISTMSDGLLLLDPKGLVLTANHALLELLGRFPVEARDQPLEAILEVADHSPDELRRLLTGEPLTHRDLSLIAAGGEPIAVNLSTSTLLDDEKQIAGVVCIITDNRARKAAREALERARDDLEDRVTSRTAELERANLEIQKQDHLRALGVVAGGIAHDFNNLLTAIRGNLELAREMPIPEQRDRAVGEAAAAADRAKDLTKQLLTFSKGGAPVKELASLSELLRETVGFVLSGARSRCEFEIAEDLSPVEVDAGQISQVLQNLAINADQAMSGGGVVEVKASNLTVPEGSELPLAAGNYVAISVSDTGAGIAEEDIERIFDPYFTRKETGSGLGLAVAHSVIERHNGHIAVTSRPADGTTFTFYLPATGGRVSAPAPVEARPGPPATGRVLVMDDEPAILRLITATLEMSGFEVEVVSDGEEAVAVYDRAREAGRGFDVVMLDLTVPGGLGGVETLGKLRALDPEVRALATSGYSDAEVMSDHEAFGFVGFIAKPFAPADLVATLSRLTES